MASITRIMGEDIVRIRFERSADKAQGGHIPEGIIESSRQIGHQDHIAGFDAFQPDRRAVEAYPGLHQIGVELLKRAASGGASAPTDRRI